MVLCCSPASSTRSSVSGDIRPGSISPRRSSVNKEDGNPFRQHSATSASSSTHSNPFATANNPFVEPGNPFPQGDHSVSDHQVSVKDRSHHIQAGVGAEVRVDPHHLQRRTSGGSSMDRASVGSSPSESSAAAVEAAHSRQSSASGQYSYNNTIL